MIGSERVKIGWRLLKDLIGNAPEKNLNISYRYIENPEHQLDIFIILIPLAFLIVIGFKRDTGKIDEKYNVKTQHFPEFFNQRIVQFTSEKGDRLWKISSVRMKLR